MPTTTSGDYGLTVPEDTDPLTDGASNVRDLGDALDELLSLFVIDGDDTQVNAALSTTANTAKLTVSLPDPGRKVSVKADGVLVSQLTGGSNETAQCTISIDGDRPAESTRHDHPDLGDPATTPTTHQRTWTPSGAFDVVLECWGGSTSLQHMASALSVVQIPAA